MLSHIKVDKISMIMIHLGLNADCWVQQNSLQLHDAPIPDPGYLKTDYVQATQGSHFLYRILDSKKTSHF